MSWKRIRIAILAVLILLNAVLLGYRIAVQVNNRAAEAESLETVKQVYRAAGIRWEIEPEPSREQPERFTPFRYAADGFALTVFGGEKGELPESVSRTETEAGTLFIGDEEYLTVNTANGTVHYENRTSGGAMLPGLGEALETATAFVTALAGGNHSLEAERTETLSDGFRFTFTETDDGMRYFFNTAEVEVDGRGVRRADMQLYGIPTLQKQAPMRWLRFALGIAENTGLSESFPAGELLFRAYQLLEDELEEMNRKRPTGVSVDAPDPAKRAVAVTGFEYGYRLETSGAQGGPAPDGDDGPEAPGNRVGTAFAVPCARVTFRLADGTECVFYIDRGLFVE